MSAVSGGETNPVVLAPGAKPLLAVPRRLLRMRSDAALAERFAAGDEMAFDVLYERHRPVVLAVCMGVLGAPPDAEDATQETFSALAVALRTRPPAELRPWLIRVARNASIDTTRRRRHRLLTLDGEIPEVAARPAASGKAELAVVLDGIRELPEGQRMALLMRELGGHSYCEIAEFLETDEESVKGLIARARVGLRTYREATELSCASARATISAEPDGRRYDKTVRRHLRTCGSCRSYRDALRDDARALRAALPIQAGTVATGGLSSGMLTTAKGTLLGYGLTQAATTCAASACAVGAIGGMVFVAPVHKLGIPLLAPVVKAKPHRHHAIARSAPIRHVVIPAHPAAPVYHSAPPPVSPTATATHAAVASTAATPSRPSAAVLQHRHHEPMTAKLHRSWRPPVRRVTAAAPSTAVPASAPVTPAPATPVSSDPSSSIPATSAPPVTQPLPDQGAGHPTGDPHHVSPGSGSPQGTVSPTGDQPGHDPGRPLGGDGHDGPVRVLIGGVTPASPQASAASAAPVPAAASSTPQRGSADTPSASTLTSPSHTRPVGGVTHGPVWDRSQYGPRHPGWHHSPVVQPTSSPGQVLATGTRVTVTRVTGTPASGTPATGGPTAGTPATDAPTAAAPSTTTSGPIVTSTNHGWVGSGTGHGHWRTQTNAPSRTQTYSAGKTQTDAGSSQPYDSSGQPARWTHRGLNGR